MTVCIRLWTCHDTGSSREMIIKAKLTEPAFILICLLWCPCSALALKRCYSGHKWENKMIRLKVWDAHVLEEVRLRFDHSFTAHSWIWSIKVSWCVSQHPNTAGGGVGVRGGSQPIILLQNILGKERQIYTYRAQAISVKLVIRFYLKSKRCSQM